MASRRRKSREFALKSLYQSEFHAPKSDGSNSAEPLFAGACPDPADIFFGAEEYEKQEREYGLGILDDFKKRREDIDSKIKVYSQNWKYERISLVDLNIMRIAILEIFYRPDVPSKAALNEALELAKEYGGEDSVSFINGILNKALQESRLQKNPPQKNQKEGQRNKQDK